MSIALPTIDLSGATIGTVYTIDLKPTGYTSDPSFYSKPGRIRIQNESGVGFSGYTKIEGHSFYIAAGQWPVIDLTPGESSVVLTVIYTIAGPPVSMILPTFFQPGEPVDEQGSLGNSPVGAVVSNPSTLSNESQGAGSLVIDVGTATNNKNFQVFSDKTVIKVEQSGVVHTAITTQIANSPLVLGQAGDTTETLGLHKFDNGTAWKTGIAVSNLGFGVATTGGGGTVVVVHYLGTTPTTVLTSVMNAGSSSTSATTIGLTTFTIQGPVNTPVGWIAIA